MFGHVVVIGGNRGMSGAIRLTAATALRCGAGLVTVLTHVENQQIVASFMPELMVYGVGDSINSQHVAEQLAKASHIIIGPGLGKDRWARQLLAQTLAHINQHNIPTVIDADALNLLAEAATPAQLPEQCVLTPHPAEAARLLNTTTKLIEADRYDAVKRLSELYNVSALIKGAGTVIYSSTSPYTYVNSTGNPGMASAGMGDVLSGVIGALLAQQMSALDAACYGVWLHGSAGDKAAKQGARGLIASDLLPFLRQLID
jgi:NAD(P)H-hydrate epimerase